MRFVEAPLPLCSPGPIAGEQFPTESIGSVTPAISPHLPDSPPESMNAAMDKAALNDPPYLLLSWEYLQERKDGSWYSIPNISL